MLLITILLDNIKSYFMYFIYQYQIIFYSYNSKFTGFFNTNTIEHLINSFNSIQFTIGRKDFDLYTWQNIWRNIIIFRTAFVDWLNKKPKNSIQFDFNELFDYFNLKVNNSLQFGFHDPATPIAEGIIDFHHDLIFLLLLISGIVFYALFEIILVNRTNFNEIPSKTIEHQLLEIIWTVIPIFILMLIALPSYALLYSLEELKNPVSTVKICGHQWYWTYEYTDKIKSIKEIFKFYNRNQVHF